MENKTTITKTTKTMKAQAIKEKAIAEIKAALKDAKKGIFLF